MSPAAWLGGRGGDSSHLFLGAKHSHSLEEFGMNNITSWVQASHSQ